MTDYDAVLAAQPITTDGSDPVKTSGLLELVAGADLIDVARCLRVLVARLPADALERRVIRNRAIAALKELRIADAAGLVDASMPGSAPAGTDGLQGQGVTLGDPDPWPEHVDGAALLDALAGTFRRFTALGAGADVVLALWTVHAHAFDAVQVSPILGIHSPEKECGKTTVLTLLLALTRRALLASNISTAGVFRTVDKYRPTLLVDEADTFLRDNEELRGILNSGHFRAGAHIVRNVGDDFEPRTFSTWCPKAIALIGELPDTLTSRSIAIQMRRCTAAEETRIEILRLDRLGQLEPLRRQAWRWAQDVGDALRAADPVLPAGLRGRAADNWRPLLAIADIAGGAWPTLGRAALQQLATVGETEQAPAVMLLADLQALFLERGVDRLASTDVVAALVQREDRPWPEWKGGRPLTVRQLARLLGRFRVHPTQLWVSGAKVRGYELQAFGDVFARYLPSHPVGTVESSNDATMSDSTIRYEGSDLPDGQTVETPDGQRTLPLLPDGDGDLGKEGRGDAWESRP
jgi:putative DNA primase/helicase